MKIALVTGGLPRFTFDFVKLMHELKGFDSADIYMTLWSTDWARTEEEARAKIEKVLLPNYKLAKIQIVDEPEYKLPSHSILLSPPTEHKYISWWYKRIYIGSLGLAWACDLIDKEYDMIFTFRVDASLDREHDLAQYKLAPNELVCAKSGHSGFNDFKLNDQVMFGSQAAVKSYCEIGKHVKELVPLSDPNWAKTDLIDGSVWTWGREHLIAYWMKKNNMFLTYGDFNISMNTFGRSRFTDKHYHHPIAQDPTEI